MLTKCVILIRLQLFVFPDEQINFQSELMVNFSFDNLEVIEGNNLNIEWGKLCHFEV